MLVSAKEHYNSYLKRKNNKLVKRSKIITQQPKALENQNSIINYYRTSKNFL